MVDPQLTREQRVILINTLVSLPLFGTQAGRDTLLTHFASNFKSLVQRSDVQRVDLDKIVEAVERWGRLADGTPALLVLLQNAIDIAQGGDAGRILQDLYKTITTPSDPPSLPPIPAAPQLSPHPPTSAPTPSSIATTSPPTTLPPPVVASTISAIARAQRYRDLKDAAAASDWRRVQELAAGIEDYRDVPDLLARADSILGQSPQLLEEIAEAYAADEWARVIVLARQIGPATAPELADWVARAWREVPVAVRILATEAGRVSSMAVTPDGGRVLIAPKWQQYIDNTWVALRDLNTGNRVKNFNGNNIPIRVADVLVIAPDGQHALSTRHTGDNRTHDLELWNLDNGEYINHFGVRGLDVQHMTISRNGQLVLCLRGTTDFWLWDLVSSQAVHTFTGHGLQVLAVAVSPNGQQALSGSFDKTLKLWDFASAQVLRTLIGHTGPVSAVTFAPDGQHALSGSSSEGALRLWDLGSGQELRTFPGHGVGVTAVAMTPDGRKIVSSGEDGTVRVWTLPPGLLSAEIL